MFTFLYILFLSSLYRGQVHIKCCSFSISILHSSHILSSSLQFIKWPVSILRGSIPHQILVNMDLMCFGVKFTTYYSSLNSVLNLTCAWILGLLLTLTSHWLISFSLRGHSQLIRSHADLVKKTYSLSIEESIALTNLYN